MMLRPGALLEISLIFYTIAVRQIKLYIIIFDLGRRYSQVQFQAIQFYVISVKLSTFFLSNNQPSLPAVHYFAFLLFNILP
jgi:hypothetical protein